MKHMGKVSRINQLCHVLLKQISDLAHKLFRLASNNMAFIWRNVIFHIFVFLSSSFSEVPLILHVPAEWALTETLLSHKFGGR